MSNVNSENGPLKEILTAIELGSSKLFNKKLFFHYKSSKMLLNELLHICCTSSVEYDLYYTKKILSLVDVDINYCDKIQKKAPIHIAAMNGCEDTLCLLLEHPQIDINVLDGDENSALHLAAIAGNVECTILLLKCEDIKPNQLNKEGLSPMYIASKSNKNNEKLVIEYFRYDKINGSYSFWTKQICFTCIQTLRFNFYSSKIIFDI